ncbi:MAG TPA: alpha/beta hydrolase [Alphaproteobacteria bacterium]
MNMIEAADGVRLYVEDFGAGLPLVFICGGNSTHKNWESQVAALAGEFRTITFDWRGTGLSDKPRTGYTGRAAAADVEALVDRLDLAPAILVGHGLGAHLALLVAYNAPHKVRGLFLTAAAPWFSGERDGAVGGVSEDFYRFMISQRSGKTHAVTVPYAETCYRLGDEWLFHRKPSPGVMQAILEQALAWPQYVLNEYAADMRAIDHRGRLATLRIPTVIAQGRRDRKQRYEGGVYMAQQIPGAKLVTLEHSATMGNMEEVEAFNAALAEFARGLAARGDVAA